MTVIQEIYDCELEGLTLPEKELVGSGAKLFQSLSEPENQYIGSSISSKLHHDRVY